MMRTQHILIYVSVVAVLAHFKGYGASKPPDGIHGSNQENADDLQAKKAPQGLYNNTMHLQVELTYHTLPREYIGGKKDGKRPLNLNYVNDQGNESTDEYAPTVGLLERLFHRSLRSVGNEDSDSKRPLNLNDVNEQSNKSTDEYAPTVGLLERLFQRSLRSVDNEDSDSKRPLILNDVNDQLNESTDEYAPKVGLLERLVQRSLRSVDNEDSENKNRTKVSKGLGGWAVPKITTVKNWASRAYASLPNRTTVTSYVPVASYLPNKTTLKSYLPSAETIKQYLPVTSEYLSTRYLGGFNPVEMLTKNDTDRLVDAMSEKILHDKDGNLTEILDEIGHNLTQQVVNNSMSMLLRMVVHKVVYGMAKKSIGQVATFFIQEKINEVTDAIADKAIVHCKTWKVDVFTYLKNMHWAEIAKGVLQMVQKMFNSTSDEKRPASR